jgi:hypothetical protein
MLELFPEQNMGPAILILASEMILKLRFHYTGFTQKLCCIDCERLRCLLTTDLKQWQYAYITDYSVKSAPDSLANGLVLWPIKDFHCHLQVKFAQLFSEVFLVCCKKNNA